MSPRLLASLGALAVVIAAASLATVPIAGQTTSSAAKTWTAPRTPNGQPDLQGTWTNATFTPLERPASLAGKEFFTEEEAAEFENQGIQQNQNQRKDDIHYDNEIWLGLSSRPSRARVVSSRRTSLIVDPPDGRIPPLTPEGRKRAADRAEARRRSPSDGPESRTVQERCIMWTHEGPPMLPQGRVDYNSNYQIFQTPGYVVIFQEMIHDARIIPLDGRPHVPHNIRQWFGDSRGRWEGKTLVVDTTNFTDKTNFRGSGEALHVVERFTRVDANTIRYEFTVEDPTTWTRPWSAEIPMRKTQDQIYEYACHEGNYDLPNILRGARAEEKAAEEASKKGSR